jgi:hypothetical protein
MRTKKAVFFIRVSLPILAPREGKKKPLLIEEEGL